jgi:hypothetical protein
MLSLAFFSTGQMLYPEPHPQLLFETLEKTKSQR